MWRWWWEIEWAMVRYALALLFGAGVSFSILWWLDDWLVAATAALATICITLPMYARREYVMERDIIKDRDEKLRAHTYATRAWMERTRAEDLERIAVERRHSDELIVDLLLEKDALRDRLLELERRPAVGRDSKGHFIKAIETSDVPAKVRKLRVSQQLRLTHNPQPMPEIDDADPS